MSQSITIKLRLKEDVSFRTFQHQFNCVVRFAYNRAMEGMAKYDVFALLNGLKHVDELDTSWRREAAKLGFAAAKSSTKKGTVAIFGGRRNFYQRLRGKIDKQTFLANKHLIPITCEGSKADRLGNRKFHFDFSTFEGDVKLGNERLSFACHKTGRKNMLMLAKLEQLLHEGVCGVTYKLSPTHFYIVFDVELMPKDVMYERDKSVTLAVDANPNYVGLSIVKDGLVVLTRAYDLSQIKEKANNKRKYELTQIVLGIKKLCAQYHVSYVGVEKLDMGAKDHGKGRRFNRQVNRHWCREYFFNSLKKHMCLIGCKVVDLVASYSSFIGCMLYPSETDSIAASIELNRRLIAFVEQYIVGSAPKGQVVYPSFRAECLNRWKKEGVPSSALRGWKAVYQWMKESGHSYRLLYPAYARRSGHRVSRLKSAQSLVTWLSGGNKIPCFN